MSRIEMGRADQAIHGIMGVRPISTDQVSRDAQFVTEYAHIVVMAAGGQRQMVPLLYQPTQHLDGAVM